MDRIRKNMRKIGDYCRSRLFAVAAFSVVFCSVLYTLVLETNAVLIRDGEQEIRTITLRDQPIQILQDEGIDTLPADQVEFTGFDQSEVAQIEIKRAFDVEITADGETHAVTMTEGSVDDALKEAGIELGEEDRIYPDVDTPLTDGAAIAVERVEYRQEEEAEPIPYETIEQPTPLLGEGKTRVLQWGVPGEKRRNYHETWIDGERVERTLTEEEVVSDPVPHIVMVGAPVPVSPGEVELDASGAPVQYERVITGAVATAYSARPGAWTASGYAAVAGTVAVDPNVIPYGSKLYIATPDFSFVYGYAVAADTGTAIMDGIIDVDLFFTTYLESCLFGKKTVDIYVLETPAPKEEGETVAEIGEYPPGLPLQER